MNKIFLRKDGLFPFAIACLMNAIAGIVHVVVRRNKSLDVTMNYDPDYYVYCIK